MIVRRVKR